MRTYGRVWHKDGSYTWTEVSTDAAGFDDYVYITALIQTFYLNLGESPFYAGWGIPAKPSVIQQIFPDYYVYLTQQRFSARFASLIISKEPSTTPTYKVNITTNAGAKIAVSIPK